MCYPTRKQELVLNTPSVIAGTINWPAAKDSSASVSVTIRIATQAIIAPARSSNLLLTDFILVWDITIRPNFFYSYTLHSLLLQPSLVVTVVIETDSPISLVSELLLEVPSEEKV